MDTLERQLKQCSLSWKTFFGAPGVTILLFLTIAATSIVVDRPRKEEKPELTFVYVPPPPAARTTDIAPLSAGFSELFKFDPAITASIPEIPLEFLEINLDPHVDPEPGFGLDIKNAFPVGKPEGVTPFVVFEQKQVDQIPVWLYGPMPRIPHNLLRTDAELMVLYIVSEEGRTDNIYILDSSDPEFIPLIKGAIARWRFQPAKKDGKPVRVWVQHSVLYRPGFKSPFSI